MADFVVSSEKSLVISGASSSSFAVAAADSYEDACSICLEPFSTRDPAVFTICKHEYHLQCILDWSQRSRECPLCWQNLVLKDSASQKLLAAVEREKNSRCRPVASAAPSFRPPAYEEFDILHDSSHIDESDFDDHIIRHLAAATNRVRYLQRRERQTFSGLNPSQFVGFNPSAIEHDAHVTYTSSPQRHLNLSSGFYVANQIPNAHPDVVSPQFSSTLSGENRVSSAYVNSHSPFIPRVLPGQQSLDSPPRRSTASELLSFSESIKSKFSAASSRYKESITKSTRGFKEKLLARNSVKDLGKGVQREMSASIAGVARVLERLEFSPKRSAASVADSSAAVENSNPFQGHTVQDDLIMEAGADDGPTASKLDRDAPLPRMASFIQGRREASLSQDGL